MCILYRYSIRYCLSDPMSQRLWAHFTIGAGFTLTSSKGKCAVSNDVLLCASSVSTAATFTVSHHPHFILFYPSFSSQTLTDHSGPARRWTSRIQRTHNLVRKQCSERSNSGLYLHHNPCYIVDHPMGNFLIQVSCMMQRGEATWSLVADGYTWCGIFWDRWLNSVWMFLNHGVNVMPRKYIGSTNGS